MIKPKKNICIKYYPASAGGPELTGGQDVGLHGHCPGYSGQVWTPLRWARPRRNATSCGSATGVGAVLSAGGAGAASCGWCMGTHTLHGGSAEGGGACCACCQRAARSTSLSHWVPRIAGTQGLSGAGRAVHARTKVLGLRRCPAPHVPPHAPPVAARRAVEGESALRRAVQVGVRRGSQEVSRAQHRRPFGPSAPLPRGDTRVALRASFDERLGLTRRLKASQRPAVPD